MVPSWSGASSWKQQLRPGEELTCTGWGLGFGSDPGYGVEFTSAESEAARAINCHINPMVGGIADYRPASGVLTSVDAAEDAVGSAPN